MRDSLVLLENLVNRAQEDLQEMTGFRVLLALLAHLEKRVPQEPISIDRLRPSEVLTKAHPDAFTPVMREITKI